MLKICLNNLQNPPHPTSPYQGEEELQEQTRIISKSIEAFEVRGIALDEVSQDKLKEISKKLSEISQKFSNNVVDSKKEFEYIITDESIISQMPEDDKQAARDRAQKKNMQPSVFRMKEGDSEEDYKTE